MARDDASRYNPPAPIATVTLKQIGADASVNDVMLLIDTGADITLLPRAAVTQLGVIPQPDAQYELIGFEGTRVSTEAVDLDMLFCKKVFRGRYLLTDDSQGILGRDALAALKLAFDGPAQEWFEIEANLRKE